MCPYSCRLQGLINRYLAQELEVAQHFSRAQHHATQRIVGDRDRQPGFFANALVEVLQECASAGQHDTVVTDVGRQLRRRAFERDADRVHDGRDALGQRLANLAVVDGDGLGYTFDQVAALDLHGQRLLQRIRGANLDLDLLGGAFADQQVVLALQVIHDGLVHLITRHAHRARVDDAAERDHGDVSGAAADIDHHVAARLRDGQARADGGDHRLFHQVHLAGLGAIGRVHDRALFYLRDLRRHADDDARMHQHLAVVRFLDEVVQHLLGDLEVGNDAVLHRLDGDDVARRTAKHLLGLFAYR